MEPATMRLICLKWAYPFVFLLGAVGNTLNLAVLLSKGMRSKTNVLLASMALSDIGCLLFMLPHTLYLFNEGPRIRAVTYVYIKYRNHATALANTFSAASSWFIVAVTIERLVAVTAPLQAKLCWRRGLLQTLIALVVVFSVAVTVHLHIGYAPVRALRTFAGPNGTNVTRAVWQFEIRHKQLVKLMTLVQFFSVVLVPLLVVAVANTALVCQLDKQQTAMARAIDGRGGERRRSSGVTRASQRRVSVMVFVIVCAFVATNAPSCAVIFWHYVNDFKQPMPKHFYTLAFPANTLVLAGKALNFFLYCTSSAYFRDRLSQLLGRHWRSVAQTTRLRTTTRSRLSSMQTRPLVLASARATARQRCTSADDILAAVDVTPMMRLRRVTLDALTTRRGTPRKSIAGIAGNSELRAQIHVRTDARVNDGRE